MVKRKFVRKVRRGERWNGNSTGGGSLGEREKRETEESVSRSDDNVTSESFTSGRNPH